MRYAGRHRRGLTLVHVQTAIAVSAIAAAALATTIATLYRMQHATDEIRQRDASVYRFERQFRSDARLAESAILTDGVLRFGGPMGEVQYARDGGRLVRAANAGDVASHQVLYVPDDMQARLSVDDSNRQAAFVVAPKEGEPGHGYRVVSAIGRSAIQLESKPPSSEKSDREELPGDSGGDKPS